MLNVIGDPSSKSRLVCCVDFHKKYPWERHVSVSQPSMKNGREFQNLNSKSGRRQRDTTPQSFPSVRGNSQVIK